MFKRGDKVIISVDVSQASNEGRKKVQGEEATIVSAYSDFDNWYTVKFNNDELNTYHGTSPFVFYNRDIKRG